MGCGLGSNLTLFSVVDFLKLGVECGDERDGRYEENSERVR